MYQQNQIHILTHKYINIHLYTNIHIYNYLYRYLFLYIWIYPRLRQQPATALDARSSSQVGSQNPSSWAPKSTNLGSKMKKNPSSKIHQVGLQNQENQSWEDSGWGLGAILGHLGPQEPPKTKMYFQNKSFAPLLGTHFGGQNLPKINFLGFQEVLIF